MVDVYFVVALLFVVVLLLGLSIADLQMIF